jgi:hypothetical protein
MPSNSKQEAPPPWAWDLKNSLEGTLGYALFTFTTDDHGKITGHERSEHDELTEAEALYVLKKLASKEPLSLTDPIRSNTKYSDLIQYFEMRDDPTSCRSYSDTDWIEALIRRSEKKPTPEQFSQFIRDYAQVRADYLQGQMPLSHWGGIMARVIEQSIVTTARSLAMAAIASVPVLLPVYRIWLGYKYMMVLPTVHLAGYVSPWLLKATGVFPEMLWGTLFITGFSATISFAYFSDAMIMHYTIGVIMAGMDNAIINIEREAFQSLERSLEADPPEMAW